MNNNTGLQIINSIPSALQPSVIPTPKKGGIPPIPPHLLNIDELTAEMIAPKQFFSMTDVKAELGVSGNHSIKLTMTSISLELVFKPEEAPTPDDWKICAHFLERKEMLVIGGSRSRTGAIRDMCNTSLVSEWITFIATNNPIVELYIDDSHTQQSLMIMPAMAGSVPPRMTNVTPLSQSEEDEIPF